jgi:hypothetical protein
MPPTHIVASSSMSYKISSSLKNNWSVKRCLNLKKNPFAQNKEQKRLRKRKP